MKSNPNNPQWWLDRLEGVRPSSDGSWLALCPAHLDANPSLHITDQDGEALVYCFAGCEYSDILKTIEGEVSAPQEHSPIVHQSDVSSPSHWWETYTQIPWERWEEWGVREEGDSICFHWRDHSSIQKYRQAHSKNFVWVPSGSSTPPLWPYPDTLNSTRIWITEGESDCGVLRYLGYSNAFAVTKGASSKKDLIQIWSSLKTIGIEEVVILFDIDSVGVTGSSTLKQALQEIGLSATSLDITPLLNPLLGEKDLRDLWCRVQDPKQLRNQIDNLFDQAQKSIAAKDLCSLDDFLSVAIIPESWLVKKIWLREAVGMIVGFPKIGKSWLGLDLAISIASQTPFLGHFDIGLEGPVVMLTKEDPDYLLQDRLQKILISKDLGGTVVQDENGFNIIFPSGRGFPLYFDLSREFLFTPDRSQELMIWLKQIYSRHGSLALVIFDPILRMLSDTDEFKASEVNTAVFSITARIQKEFGAGSVLVHHRSKAVGKDKSSYGSIAFHAFSENTIYVLGEGPDAEGWIYAKNEFKSSSEYNWKFRFLDLDQAYEIEVMEVSPSQKLGTGKQILNLLQSVAPEGLLVTQIGEAFTDLSDYLTRDLLKQLESQNFIYKEKDQESTKAGPKADRWFARRPDELTT